MADHDDLLARLDGASVLFEKFLLSARLARSDSTLFADAATAIQSLQAQLEAERRAREEAERKCAQLVMDGMDEEVKLKQRAEAAARRLAEVEQDARRYQLLVNAWLDIHYPLVEPLSACHSKVEMDAAIDAAIKESAAQEKDE